MRSSKATPVPPDGGWGWVVAIASFFNAATMFGVLKSGGILYVAITHVFEVSRAKAALVPSLAFSISCILGPVASVLSTRFSYRSVIFVGAVLASAGTALSATLTTSYAGFLACYGVITGIGCGLIVVPNIIIVHLYFKKHRALASGFAMAGGSIGCLAIPPLLEWIVDEHGFIAALLTLSAILLHICPSALLLRPLPIPREATNTPQNNEEHAMVMTDKKFEVEDGLSESAKFLQNEDTETKNGNADKKLQEKNLTTPSKKNARIDTSTFRKKYFYLILFSLCCITYTWVGYLTLLPDYAAKEAVIGLKRTMAALLLSFMSIGDVTFRIIGGWLMDRPWINRKYALAFLFFISSMFMFLYSYAHTYTYLVAISVLFGIFMGGVIILPPVLLADALGPSRFPIAFGISGGINGLVMLFAATSLAYIRDLTNSYKPCFMLMSGILATNCIVWTVDSIYTRLKGSRSKTEVNAL